MNAVQIKNSLLTAGAVIGSAVAQALGGWDAAMRVLAGMMISDYITGILVAGIWHKSRKSTSGTLDSRAGFQGICRKGAILLLVYLSVLLDEALGVTCVRTAVILFFIGNEGLSLLENLGMMGVPFPAFLQRSLEALREQGDSGKADPDREITRS